MQWVPFALAGLLGAILATPLWAALIKRSGSGQPIREYGPTIHEHKRGTPTMGGAAILIVFSVLLVSYQAAYGPLTTQCLLLIAALIGFGLVGLADDALKFLQQRSGGLSPRYKLLLQLIVTSGFLAALMIFGLFDASLELPFIPWDWEPGLPLAALIASLTLLGTVNALNLTDGLDGLAGGISLILLIPYGVIVHSSAFGSGLSPLTVMLGGVILGFLMYNIHPAQIFLGDTGSMALGGFISGLSVLTGTELILLILGIVPLLEALSVILQVGTFRLFHKRIFKVSPLHHHFERAEGIDHRYVLPGAEWPEWAVTLLLWGVAVMGAAVGLLAYLH